MASQGAKKEVLVVEELPHPEDLPGDVGNPVFFQLVPLGVFHQVRN